MYHASHVEGLTVVCKEGEGPKVNGERLDEVLVWDIMTCDEPWAPVEVRILIYIYNICGFALLERRVCSPIT